MAGILMTGADPSPGTSGSAWVRLTEAVEVADVVMEDGEAETTVLSPTRRTTGKEDAEGEAEDEIENAEFTKYKTNVI